MRTGPTSQSQAAPRTAANRQDLFRLFKEHPLPDEELLVNMGLFIRSGALARILFLNEIYQKILTLPGIVCEFGVWWGQSLVLFENFRAIHEPYNSRQTVGFDTFAGYASIGESDKRSATISEGVYGVPAGYEDFLDQLLTYHQHENVMSHVRKHELVKGDAGITSKQWFDENAQALVALAFFDMALYEPTKAALQAVKPRLVRGSIVAFDELCSKDYPGETRAALEVLGTAEFEVQRSRFLPDRIFFTRL
jgi:hypothetical protein